MIDDLQKALDPYNIEVIGQPGLIPRLILKFESGFKMVVTRMPDMVVMANGRLPGQWYDCMLKDPNGRIVPCAKGGDAVRFQTAKQVKLLIIKAHLQSKVFKRKRGIPWVW